LKFNEWYNFSMSENVLGAQGQKTIKHTEDDVEMAETAAVAGMSASTAHSELLTTAVKFRQPQDEKNEELEERQKTIDRERRRWRLD